VTHDEKIAAIAEFGPIAIYGLTVRAEAIVELVLSQPVAQRVCFIA
jgi:hypothetical protein